LLIKQIANPPITNQLAVCKVSHFPKVVQTALRAGSGSITSAILIGLIPGSAEITSPAGS
jgi:hypothetical protein